MRLLDFSRPNFGRKGSLYAAAFAVSASMLFAYPFTAQDAAAQGTQMSGIDVVTVSARKREETIMDVPIAMQAFSMEDLERYATGDLTEVAELASQVLLFPASSGAGAAFGIRGISATTLDPGINTSVTIDVDGMGINRGRIVRQALFDVESVEILKGPQALFFGKNSPAGVVSINSAGATDEFFVKGRVFYEFEAQELQWEGVVAGPINEKVGFRLAYQGTDSDGFVKNVAGPIEHNGELWPLEPFDFPGARDNRKGGVEEHMARLTLEFDPTDRFSAVFKVTGTTLNGDGTAGNELVNCTLGFDRPVTNTLAGVFGLGAVAEDPYGDCELDGKGAWGDLPDEIAANYDGLEDRPNGQPFSEYDSVLLTLEMEYEFDNFVLSSNTGFYYYDWFRWDNFDGTTYIQLMGIQDEQQDTFQQELRLLSTFDGPINFMIGGFYENFTRDSDNQGKIVPLGADPTTGFYNNWSGISTVKGDSFSLFGQVIWDITPDLELAGGLRWSKEDKDMSEQNIFVHRGGPDLSGGLVPGGVFIGDILFSPVGDVINATFDDEDVSPEVTLTWNATENITVFAAYKTGYKAGGFSTQTVIPPGLAARPQDTVYGAESAEGFEIGVKTQLLDGRLRLNGSIYRYEYKGLQVSAFDSETVSFSIRNAADARIQGFEFDFNYLATDELQLRGQVGFNDSKYTSFPGAPCWSGQLAIGTGCDPVSETQDLSGQDLTRAPEWSGSVGFTYDTAVSNSVMIGIGGDVVYTDGYETQLALNPFSFQPSTTRINASLRVYSPDDTWEFALIGRNLNNDLSVSGTADKPGGGPGSVYGTTVRGRQIGMQLTVRY